MAEKHTYTMRLSLSVLNHLGLNLYSNIPAVLSEAVANSWDADAKTVKILIDPKNERIEIEDDGYGMTQKDINKKYLNVGYQKRKEEGDKTPSGRFVMGRKGIGKLSLFSIAKQVEIHSVKNGEGNGLQMSHDKIQEQIVKNKGIYHPKEVDPSSVKIRKGTKIILKDLKRNISKSEAFLRKRLARRFSIIGAEHHFQVFIKGTPIGLEDRDFFDHIQFLWTIGKEGKEHKNDCKNLKKTQHLDGIVDEENGFRIWGWIGAVEKHGQLSEGNNKITILARGKLVQEDILEDFPEGGLYTKYLIGEITANFLDQSDCADITTSNRQRLIEDDERYKILKRKILSILKEIQGVWTEWRNEYATEKALKNPAIEEWYNSLKGNQRKYAERIFGKIESVPAQKEEDKKELYKYGILAFERLRVRSSLEKLDKITDVDSLEFSSIFNELEDIEAILYYDIASERVKVINAFANVVDKNKKEKVIQKYIFDHLWLLHPSWERATENERMEQTVDKEFKKIDAKLKKDEKLGRIDIRYRTAAGKHIIIELKRPEKKVSVLSLVEQIKKYRDALRKCLAKAGRESEPVEIICILGQPLIDDDEEFIRKQLSSVNARIVFYDSLIQDSLKLYRDYLEKKKKVDRLRKVIDSI